MPAGAEESSSGNSNTLQEATSALEASIQAKGDQSYYYAHKRKGNEQPAPLPVHTVLHRTPSEPSLAEESISPYSFLDDGGVIKVYAPLEGVGELKEGVTATFGPKSFELRIVGAKPGKVLRLGFKGTLHGELEPEACTYKVLSNKVILTLAKKAPAEGERYPSWHKLVGT